MAKKKESPVADESTGKIKVKEKPEVQPTGNETKGDITKVKAKMKQKPKDLSKETITKVDLTKKPKETEGDTDTKQETTDVVTDQPIETIQEIVEEAPVKQDAVQDEETPVVEEITSEEKDKEKVEDKAEQIEEVVADAIINTEETGEPLPENVQKLMDFMDETGGDLNDYVKLNQDYSEMDNHTLLHEYYKRTKPHLSNDEIDFIMDDSFSYDEEVDEEKQIKRKKLAMKEQVAEAKLHLESVKSKYYEDIKAGSKLSEEQQKAINFFNKYNEESESNKKMSEIFHKKSENVFNDKFKGFEYSVGDKRFRFNVKDIDKVKTTQRDINNFIGKFLNEDNIMSDAEGYHKGLFTAMNPDQVANHFYEQGKTDALKESIAKSKNVNMDPRQAHVENVNTSGFKARVLNDDGPDFKFQIKENKFKK